MNTNRTNTAHFPRIYRTSFAALLIFCAGPGIAWAQPAPAPVLVKATDANGRSTLGELKTDEGDTLELLDLKTGKKATFQKSTLNDLRKGITEKEAAETIGLPEFLVWRVRRVIPSGVSTGKIIQVDASSIYVNLGSSAGVEGGQELLVYRGAGELKNPDTGEVLGTQRRLVAKVTVTESKEKVSRVKLAGDLEIELKVGDDVQLSKKAKPIAILPFVDLNGDVRAGSKKLEEDLTTGLAQGGVSVVERTFLSKVLNELGLQNTKLFDPDKAQRVGKQLGAYAVLVGTMSGSGYRSEANLRLVKVETGEILFATRQNGPALGPIVGPGTEAVVISVESSGRSTIRSGAVNGVDWVRLFDGKTLNGWATPDSGDWQVTADGAISNNGSRGHLFTQKSYANFEIRMEIKLSPQANASLHIRSRGNWPARSSYAIKANLDRALPLTGSIVKITYPNSKYKWERLVGIQTEYGRPNEWFTLHIIAIANRIVVRINDSIVADYVDTNNPLLSGILGFYQERRGATVLFRNSMIKALADDNALALAQAKSALP